MKKNFCQCQTLCEAERNWQMSTRYRYLADERFHMPDWNILLVLNFVILARKYFVGFYFCV